MQWPLCECSEDGEEWYEVEPVEPEASGYIVTHFEEAVHGWSMLFAGAEVYNYFNGQAMRIKR